MAVATSQHFVKGTFSKHRKQQTAADFAIDQLHFVIRIIDTNQSLSRDFPGVTALS